MVSRSRSRNSAGIDRGRRFGALISLRAWEVVIHDDDASGSCLLQRRRDICRDAILIVPEETISEIVSSQGELFRITHQFEEPACRVFIKGHAGERLLFRSAMRMGMHTSEDWEAVSLAEPFELCFRCELVEDKEE